MKKVVLGAAIFLMINAGIVIAHHPAVDMVDSEIYAMIDSMVADTPHADMTFDDMGDEAVSVITVDSVSETDALIDDGLLDDLSLLDGEVTITIQFPEEEESLLLSVDEINQSTNKDMKWSPWGRKVEITIHHIYDTE